MSTRTCADCGEALDAFFGTLCQKCAALADDIYPGGSTAREATLERNRNKE